MDKEFWNKVGEKVIETIISVKVLTIAAFMVVSTWLCINGFLDGKTWATANGAIITTVYALREGFKIARVRNGDAEAKKKLTV